MDMTKQKREYLAPEAEVVELMTEQVIALSGDFEQTGEEFVTW